MSADFASLIPVYCGGTAFTAVAFAWACRKRLDSRAAIAVLSVVSVFFTASTVMMGFGKAAALNHYADRATHLEILWRSVHGLGLTSPMSESFFNGSHWFAAHFTPIIFIAYRPFFALWPSDGCLTILQALYVGSAAIPIGLFAAQRLGRTAGALFAASYLLYPTVQYVALYGTAYLELSIPLIAWALYALEKGRLTLLCVAAAAALSVREEMGLIVAALGIYAFARGRRGLGATLALAGAAYFVLALKVIIPSYRSDGSLVFLGNYASWGRTPEEILLNAVGNPLATVVKLSTMPRLGNAVMYLLPLGFLPLLDPLGLLIALPNVASTFMSDSVSNYNFTLYYVTPSIAALFFAAVRGAARLPGAETGVLAASLCCAIFFGASPISLQFWTERWKVGLFHTTSYHRSQYVASDAARAARRVAALVPREAQVSAEQHLLPLLYDRRRMLVFPTLDAQVDHVVIDRAKRAKTGWADTYLSFRADPERYYALVEKSGAWELVAEDGGARLYRRRSR